MSEKMRSNLKEFEHVLIFMNASNKTVIKNADKIKKKTTGILLVQYFLPWLRFSAVFLKALK